ncbi:UDP-2,3-diacetamido-2,3-dideoxy-D-glucuronate 2-epimerase [Pseudobythopirellula maris]|uniref:UDP-2,3-diacetamido-2,3-dideoxy-D-glucuronate 2-epimerase n=1 Tax=Pseudobythopirellula maris TaxID=2527991 RepID=A0A5C5ZI98_9BACT|nr:UDP-N-acetylglucosamine 2-epimerase (non-hydrolyzing) [Pseudobythopirellula maris]TWT87102.1 UDP-2,3-diacetamido-2,3-dideoxy-D-glucuronate 2-epimerase [Pseudobythopirellula maris]
MSKPLKIMTVLGTRPEIIRLSRVMALLDQHVEHVIVHTGQNSDYELNEVFFDDLRVRQPDHFLGIRRDSLGVILGDVMVGAERVLKEEKPDAVLILGDTNSAFAAVIARRMKVPVYHMEAGNRCFDFNVPEEINRRIVDHISDFNLVYTEHARRNLLAEGVHPRRVYLTGSPMREVLDDNAEGIETSDATTRLGLEEKRFIVVSLHRAENVDREENLRKLLGILNSLAERHGMPVIVSTHPRTQARLDELASSQEGSATADERVRFLKPFGYHDYVRLQRDAFCTVSDSGTISEESSILGFPAVTTRTAIERPEAMDSGHIVLTGLDVGTVLESVEFVTKNRDHAAGQPIAAEYQVTNVSHRVVKLILGTAKLGHLWDGIVAA